MRNLRTLSALLVALVFLASCGVHGSGDITSEDRKVNGFSAVALSGQGHLVIEQGDTESLSITADDNLLRYLKSEVQGKTLHLGTEELTSVRPTREIVYLVKVKQLEGISVSGNAKISATGVQSKRLSLSVSGSAEIDIDGTVEHQDVQISGAGKYRAQGLQSKVASLSVSGTASGVVAASEKLDVSISGAGDIEYVGEPTVTQHISGAATIRRKE